ncbi:MAG: ATP-binding protein, partial [Patescibacteria group bacterium]
MIVKSRSENNGYTAKDIYVLEGLEPVRKRPGMYVGSTGVDGLHHLIWEVFDNGRDEAMAGFANEVEVTLLPHNKVRVADNGRGIPVEMHKQTKKSALETVMTTLHAGGKFGGESYKIAGGLHGVGVSVVNALSVWMRAEVYRDGGKYVQEYKRGKAISKVEKIGPSKLNGTVVTFEPDSEIFKEIKFDWNKILNHLRQQAYLTKGLKIRVIDLRNYSGKIDDFGVLFLNLLHLSADSHTFYFEGGVISLVQFLNKNEKPIQKKIFYTEKQINGMIIEIALQYVEDIGIKELSFANNIHTPEGGMHLTGFRTALTRTINDYARKNNLIKSDEENFIGDDVREGLTAVVSVKLREPQFEGQTKAKLGNPEARTAVENVFSQEFSSFLEENPNEARMIASKVILALKARKAAKAAKESVLRKGFLEGLALPGKLADCQSHDPVESELFIVEGDSAGG